MLEFILMVIGCAVVWSYAVEMFQKNKHKANKKDVRSALHNAVDKVIDFKLPKKSPVILKPSADSVKKEIVIRIDDDSDLVLTKGKSHSAAVIHVFEGKTELSRDELITMLQHLKLNKKQKDAIKGWFKDE